jgi:hypothetical protein
MTTEKAINKMMEISGYMARYHHLSQMGDYPWYSKYTCTLDEESEFRKWFIKEDVKNLRKKFGDYSKELAQKHWAAFWFMYGLKTIIK